MFNTRLRSLRMKYKYTQQNMADMLQISLNAYQKYEQAERSASMDSLVKLAYIFIVLTDLLLCRDEFMNSLGVSVDEYQ